MMRIFCALLLVLILGSVGCGLVGWLQSPVDPENPDGPKKGDEIVATAVPWLPPPWGEALKWGWPILVGGAEATRRSVKNSPEGSTFGPILKPKA